MTEPVTDEMMRAAYWHAYASLIQMSSLLETLMAERTGGDGVEPHAGAALWAVRLAAVVLRPAVDGAPAPPFTDDSDRLLYLAGQWRDAAFGLGEFAQPPVVLRLVEDGEGRHGEG
ncbi:hypothetical protein ACFV6E_37185 [Streptomyces sp. NPDC059785]|uniref:hypothetical protein n=1 Tax=unclassified Streptomyces TaxID=2593676 RepID=UPI0036507D12